MRMAAAILALGLAPETRDKPRKEHIGGRAAQLALGSVVLAFLLMLVTACGPKQGQTPPPATPSPVEQPSADPDDEPPPDVAPSQDDEEVAPGETEELEGEWDSDATTDESEDPDVDASLEDDDAGC